MNGFFDVYTQSTGTTPIPAKFYRWSALSLVAAVLENRVWIQHYRQPLMPNLYVLLVGPSGAGKGSAIDSVLTLWHTLYGEAGRLLRGGLTKQRLLDVLGGRTTGVIGGQSRVIHVDPNPHPWIVSPELYNALGSGGPVAESFIANLTDLYTYSPVAISEGTRTWGTVTMHDVCINWLAGSTAQWLRRSLSPDAILSGFFGRVVAVEGAYSDQRMTSIYPPNLDVLLDQCQTHLVRLSRLTGEYTMTDDADEVCNQWMQSRDVPEDEFLRPAHQRDLDLLMKLSMLLSAAESDDLVIDRRHVARARTLVAEARASLPMLVNLAHATSQSDGLGSTMSLLKRSGYMSERHLLKLLSNRGVTADQLQRFVNTLELSERITIHRTSRGRAFQWRSESKAF
jgi:hypothetical protein